MDALSELLRAVKLSGALFYDSRCSAPWCLNAPHSNAFAPFVARHAVDQAAAARPGSAVFLAHLAEALFADVLRRYLASLPDGRTGWLAGAGDSAVGRALGALHRNPAHAWTLDELAREAGVSRSALAERFTKYLGVAPMSYLTDWRLEIGAESLRSTSRSVQSVALDVGYESEAAFNRAFKRKFAVPPARHRREWRARTKRT